MFFTEAVEPPARACAHLPTNCTRPTRPPRRCLRPGPLVVAVLLSHAELVLRVRSLLGGGARASPALPSECRPAAFIYASMTVAGCAPHFCQGVWVLPRPACSPCSGQLGTGTGRSVAAAATFVHAAVHALVRGHCRAGGPCSYLHVGRISGSNCLKRRPTRHPAHLFQSSAHRHLNMGTLGGFPFPPRWCAAGKAGGLPTRPSHTSDFFGPSLKFLGRGARVEMSTMIAASHP